MQNQEVKEKLEACFSKLAISNDYPFTYHIAHIVKGLHAHTCMEVRNGAGEDGLFLDNSHSDTSQIVDFLMDLNELYLLLQQ